MANNVDELGRLLFELALLNQASSNLDDLLRELFSILSGYPTLGIKQQAAILLYNPFDEAIQVAQIGLPPTWSTDCTWPCFKNTQLSNTDMPVLFIGEQCIQVIPKAFCNNGPVCILSLMHEQTPIGYAVLFLRKTFEQKPELIPILENLARALSSLIRRVMTNEIVQIREWELEEARTEVIQRLGSAAEHRDQDTGWHVMRMTNYALAIAKQIGLSEEQRELLSIAAPMHDVGKIGIPDQILRKQGALSAEELVVMRRHTEIGEMILKGSDRLITAAREIAAAHHEHWNGLGYPRGLKGEEIPILARICTVADVFDALTSTRPYKPAWTIDDAILWIQQQSGQQFDPAVVDAFHACITDILRIRELYREDLINPREMLDLPAALSNPKGWVSWDDSLSVGIDVLDEHHKHLFDLINRLFEVVTEHRGTKEVARVLKSLDLYARVHFRAEERLMQEHNYVGLTQQKYQHHQFMEELQSFYKKLHVNPLTTQYDVLQFARTWLVTHILEEDMQLEELTKH